MPRFRGPSLSLNERPSKARGLLRLVSIAAATYGVSVFSIALLVVLTSR